MIEIIEVEEERLSHGTIHIKEIVNLGPGDVIERVHYDSEKKMYIIRVRRAV